MRNKSKALIISAVLLASTSVLADSNKYYIKGSVGNNKFYPVKNFDNFKQKSTLSPHYSFGLGFGKDLEDYRIDLTVEHTVIGYKPNYQFNKMYSRHFTLQSATINSINLNLTADVLNVTDYASLFIGGGLGYAQINERIEWKFLYPEKYGSHSIKKNLGYLPRKTAYNLCHNYTAGVNYKANGGMVFDVAYKYHNYGSTKDEVMGITKIDGKRYHGHGVNVGFKYSL